MSNPTTSLLLDTNVWVDFFIDRNLNHDHARKLVKAARAKGVPLFTSIETTKDVFFIVALELKRAQREASRVVTDEFANAVNETAWSCLGSMRRQSTVIGADHSDMIEAMTLRHAHGDYEDNLIVAAAMRAKASHIVSSDEQLRKHSPIPCISVEEALATIAA